MALTEKTLVHCGVEPNLARAHLPHMAAAMREFGITTKPRARMFLAQVLHESANLIFMEEIASGADYENRKDLGNVRKGDGVRYKGRGPIQLTGRANYRRAGEALGLDLERNPKQVSTPQVGWRTSALYFKRRCSAHADRGDFAAVTKAINGATTLGPPTHLTRRKKIYARLEGQGVVPAEGGTAKVTSLQRGDEGEAVLDMTRRLSFVSSPTTGTRYLDGKRTVFDEKTEVALIAFQRDHGLTHDGRFRRETEVVLLREVALRKKSHGTNAAGVTSPEEAPTATGGDPVPVGEKTGVVAAPVSLLDRIERLDADNDDVHTELLRHQAKLDRATATERELLERTGSGLATTGSSQEGSAAVPFPEHAPQSASPTIEPIRHSVPEADSGSPASIEAPREQRATPRSALVVARGSGPVPSHGGSPTATATVSGPEASSAVPPSPLSLSVHELLGQVKQFDDAGDAARTAIGRLQEGLARDLAVLTATRERTHAELFAAMPPVDLQARLADLNRSIAAAGTLLESRERALSDELATLRSVLSEIRGSVAVEESAGEGAVPSDEEAPVASAAGVESPEKADATRRRLNLTSPLMRGEDVEILQRAINKRLAARGTKHRIEADGECGPDTIDAARHVAFALGVGEKLLSESITPSTQRVIISPGLRNPVQLVRAQQRARHLAEEFRRGPEAVIREARKHVGKTERPSGSNRGPGIVSACQKWALGNDGWFWCGAFVGYVVHKTAGVVFSKKRIVYTPAIVADAKAGTNGFEGWYPVRQAKPGDLALFNWPGGQFVDHVEIVAKNLGGGRLLCIGGNTGMGGRQNNGGGIYEQERRTGLAGVARPRYR